MPNRYFTCIPILTEGDQDICNAMPTDEEFYNLSIGKEIFF